MYFHGDLHRGRKNNLGTCDKPITRKVKSFSGARNIPPTWEHRIITSSLHSELHYLLCGTAGNVSHLRSWAVRKLTRVFCLCR